jgi:zinc transport system substrate-binding protein
MIPNMTLAADAEATKTRIFVSIPPQQYIAERVGGDRIDVEALVPAGRSPETFEPTARQMARLSESEFLFTVGFLFEQRLVDKLGGSGGGPEVVAVQFVGQHETAQANTEPPKHGHSGDDPHIWLDLKFMKRQAELICGKLSDSDSANREYFAHNLTLLTADLDSLDARVRSILHPIKGRRFYVFHPAFGWFAESYDLIQIPIEVEGKEPGGEGLSTLIEQASKESVRAIFVQSGFSDKGAKAVADAIGASIVPLDPLSRDFITNYESMARTIAHWLLK